MKNILKTAVIGVMSLALTATVLPAQDFHQDNRGGDRNRTVSRYDDNPNANRDDRGYYNRDDRRTYGQDERRSYDRDDRERYEVNRSYQNRRDDRNFDRDRDDRGREDRR